VQRNYDHVIGCLEDKIARQMATRLEQEALVRELTKAKASEQRYVTQLNERIKEL
jgi:hypothetical protein